MKVKIFLVGVLVSLCSYLQAQSILDRTLSVLESKNGSISADFVFNNNTQQDFGFEDCTGHINIKQNRFSILSDQLKLWFDGTTMWSYVPDETVNEIYVSNPDSHDLDLFNPYFVIKNRSQYTYVSEKKILYCGRNAFLVEMKVNNSEFELFRKAFITISGDTYLPLKVALTTEGEEEMTITLNDVKTRQSLRDSDFVCPTDSFPEAEVIDMR